MKKSLAVHSSLSLVANLLFAACNWLLLVIIAKQFTEIFLGQFVMALSIVSPVFLLANLKLRTILLVDLTDTHSTETYLSTRFTTNSIAFLVSLAIGYWGFSNIPVELFILIGLYKCFDSTSELLFSYHQRIGRFDYVALSLGGRSILTMLILVMLSYFYHNPLVSILGWVCIAFGFVLIDLNHTHQCHLAKTNKGIAWGSIFIVENLIVKPVEMVRRYYTLSVSVLMGALFVYIPNFVIEAKLGLAQAGQFATVSYFLIAGGVLISSVSQAASPRLSRLILEDKIAGYLKLTRLMCLIGAGIGLLGVLVALFLGVFFLTLFYNETIAQLNNELVWVMVAAAIRYIYIFIGTAMNAIKAFKLQTYIYTTGTVSVFFACLYCIPHYGLIGAAYAMVSATAIECLLFIYFFRLKLKQVKLGKTQ